MPGIFIFISILSPNNPGRNVRVVSVRNPTLTLVLFPYYDNDIHYFVEIFSHHNYEVKQTFTLIAALSYWTELKTEVPPIPPTLLPGLGLPQADHVDDAALLLSDPASRALPSLTEGSKVPGTGRVLC